MAEFYEVSSDFGQRSANLTPNVNRNSDQQVTQYGKSATNNFKIKRLHNSYVSMLKAQ